MKIQDLTPPAAVSEPEWKRQLVEFWQQADDFRKIDLQVSLKMGDAVGARQLIESWQQTVAERQQQQGRNAVKEKAKSGPKLEVVQDFVDYCVQQLAIEQAPRIRLRRDPAWSERNRSFGQFDADTNELNVSTAGRHVMDIFRTVAHELVHYQQNQQGGLPDDAGATGSEYENEANARAGVLMRDYAQLHPEHFEDGVVAESSGYIPTKRERNDPRFVMALSPDVKPGATGKNANRLGLKTGPQGEPTPLMKNLRNALREFKETNQLPVTEEQDLMEIDMSPSNLRKLVRNINAQAGIEFEMIIPGISVEDEGESEPDWDQDERIRSIDDAVSFFDDGDYNSSREIRNLREELNNEYYEWYDEQIMDKWQEEGRDYLRDYIHNNDLYDGSEEDLELQTENSWEEQDRNWETALDEFREEFGDTVDDGDWLRSAGYDYATDIERNFDINWPHYTMMGGDAEMDIDSVAEEFSQAVGRPVNSSTSYHGARREPGVYVVEPDGSLEGDEAGDGGLEFVSPPLPLDELLSDMQKIRTWAKQRGAYTNSSTGLHMNVSVPDMSTAKLDYVKLALLLGDEHVLEQFGRSANTYTGSALKKIREIIKNDPSRVDEVLAKMREHMESLATKVIHTGETQKFTSINTKGNYVEFRSPGGDYLDANWDKVVPTLLRTVVALDAAMDPAKYRQEYQKKLYKLLDSAQTKTASPNVNKLLSMYFTDADEGGSRDVARQLAKELLTKRQAEREAGKGERDFWWRVTMPSGSRIEVVARTEQEAREKAARQWGFDSAEYTTSRARVEPLRPADSDAGAKGSGRWGIWITGLNKFATINKERLEFPSRQEASEWYQDRVLTTPGTRSDVEIREIPAEPGETTWRVKLGAGSQIDVQASSEEEALTQAAKAWGYASPEYLIGATAAPAPSTQPIGNPTAGNTAEGNVRYYIRDVERDQIVHRFYARDANEAVAELAWWKQQNPGRDLKFGRDDDAAAPAQAPVPAGQAMSGDWAVWSTQRERFATIGNAGARRFNTRADAEAWIQNYNTQFPEQNLGWVAREFAPPAQRQMQPGDIVAPGLGEVPAPAALPDLFPELPAPDFSQLGSGTSGSQRWKILSMGTGRQVGEFNADSYQDAIQHMRQALTRAGLDPEQYTVSPVESSPAPAARTGEFTGEWRIVAPDGTEVHRFGGVGNVQADANRVAMAWLQRNPRHMIDGTEVVPVMSE
jgi:hypothetical protein